MCVCLSAAHAVCGMQFYYVAVERLIGNLYPSDIDRICQTRGSRVITTINDCLKRLLLGLQPLGFDRTIWTGTCNKKVSKCNQIANGEITGPRTLDRNYGRLVRYGICQGKKHVDA